LNMTRRLALLALLAISPSIAFAQSTATPVLPGLLVTSGCLAPQTSCYVPYSNANPLPVAGNFTGSSASVGLIGTTAPTSADQIGFLSGADLVNVSSSNPLPISGSFSLTNPTVGASVPSTANYIAANQSGTLTGLLLDGSSRLEVNVEASALPTGAATSANQPTVNAAGSGSATSLITVQGNASGTPIPVVATGAGATTTNGSSSITTGGTFQSALASNSSRKGCLIQNPVAATETLFVFLGATGSATTANSISLSPGSIFYCAGQTGVVATDNVAITAATTGHTYVEMSQ
jgi:hypothetical protein